MPNPSSPTGRSLALSPTAVSWLALGTALLSLVVALVPRGASVGESRRGTSGTDPASRGRTEESSSKAEALTAEIAELRRDVAALSASDQRRSLGPDSAYAGGASPSDGGFQERSALLQGFQRLEPGDRKEALERLAELARWGDAEALAAITRSLSDPSASVRARALEEIVDLDEANKAVHLRSALDDASPKVREVAASLLDELHGETAGPLLVGLLRDADKHVVTEAIESLGDVKYAQARPMLLEQLQAPSLDVATSAARALMKLGEPAPLATIQRILAAYADEDVSGRVENVKRLRRLKATGPLENILATDTSLAVREEARAALASLEE